MAPLREFVAESCSVIADAVLNTDDGSVESSAGIFQVVVQAPEDRIVPVSEIVAATTVVSLF